jgi:anti-anti-sigma factor
MSEIDSPHFRVGAAGSIVVVHLLDRDLRFPEQVESLSKDLSALATRLTPARLLLEMGHTKYLCSTGFATLINLARRVTAAGGTIAICNMDPDVRFGADIIRLGDYIPIFEDQATALASS